MDRVLGAERADREWYVVGDFNARVGCPQEGEVLWAREVDARNENGGRLVAWASEIGLARSKTFLKGGVAG